MNREILFRGFHECENGKQIAVVNGKVDSAFDLTVASAPELTTAEKLYSLVQKANENASFFDRDGFQSVLLRFIDKDYGYVRVGKETFKIDKHRSLDEAINAAYEKVTAKEGKE